MLLKIVHKNDAVELLDIKPPFVVVERDESLTKFNVLTDATGTDYYFWKTGEYDGWGRTVGSGTEEEAMGILDEMDTKKTMIPPNIQTEN